NEVIKTGTGAIEIKSGYGLSVDAELKMLRVIKALKATSPIPIKATFLGAHAFPAEFKDNHEGYIDLIINEMLPVIAKEGLADYIDAFCERGYYNVEETDRIMKAGIEHGLKPKIHINQFSTFGGVQMAVANKALSIDHLEVMNDDDIESLKGSDTIPTLLPSCSFFLSIDYAPARKLIEADLPVALATDYNPGSTPSGNIPFVLSLACIKQKMTPEEVINASTLNAAAAIELEDELGSITRGKRANLIITQPMPNLAYWMYSFGKGNQLIKSVVV
ncbi:MAG: imidazolonepropionase, partial [Bacteroidia bacterium]